MELIEELNRIKRIMETFINYDVYDEKSKNLNLDRPEKRTIGHSTMKINKNNHIKQGFNDVFLNDEHVGTLTIGEIGNINIGKEVFKDSILLVGGFVIFHKFRNMGIGRELFRKIFKDNPKIENILLYAVSEQGSIEFWQKIGGEILNINNNLYFIKLNRNDIK